MTRCTVPITVTRSKRTAPRSTSAARLRTIPRAAVELGISAQLHRWRRDNKIDAKRNELGHWIVDVDRIDPELVEQCKTLSETRYGPGETTIERTPRAVSPTNSLRADDSEAAYLREQLAKALEVINRLSGGRPPAEG